MDKKIYILSLIFLVCLELIHAQHEDIPYESVDNICAKCVCATVHDADKRYHHTLSCALKNFKHILARWPDEFGSNHEGADIVATFSGNSIEILQQLPATNGSLTFSCRHCGIKHLQAPTFMDVPNINRLDLSWNELTTDELIGEVFRGPFRTTRYEPIALREIDLSHNKFYSLDRKIFEHTPKLTKLNLSYNNLTKIDTQLSAALSSVRKLEILDLSYTTLSTLSDEFFKSLVNLKELRLAGNNFIMPPAGLKLIGGHLMSLNLAKNIIKTFDEHSFEGLITLRRLNISNIETLTKISKSSFSHFRSLESLDCSHNPLIETFDLNDLLNSENLTQLDLSYSGIVSLPLNITTTNLTTNKTLPKPWPKLRSIELIGNPLLCDCDLLQALEYIRPEGAEQRYADKTRCDAPYIFAGALVSNLTASTICSMQIPKKYQVVDEDPPRFLRKRYIILTLITASVVIGIGLIIGFVVSCIRRRLKREDFGVEPIRYTSVRCSNLSAFSNSNQNNRNTA